MSITGSTVIPISERARLMFQGGALNTVYRDATQLAGEGWIADRFPGRWHAARAISLGYGVSMRVDPWSTRDAARWPATYLDRKRQWQGHADPMVWTGRLRAAVWHTIHTRAVATKGEARGEIILGPLNVTDPRTGAEGSVQLPARHVVRRVLTAMPADDEAYLAEQFLAVVADRLQAQGAPAKTAGRLAPEPPVISDRRIGSARRTLMAGKVAAAERASIGRHMSDRRARINATLRQWRQQSGGSAPMRSALGRAMNAAEARAAHNSQSRQSYHRRRSSILSRRRAARSLRRGFAFLRQHTVPRKPRR